MSRVITAQTDPDTARSYWTMKSRRQRARLSRRAPPQPRRTLHAGGHTGRRRGGSDRLCARDIFQSAARAGQAPGHINDLVVSGTKVTMENPRMTGFTKDGRAYEFIADAAAQDLTKPDVLELRNIRAKLAMQDQSTMDLSADTGVYDTKRETLRLDKNIVLLSSNGNKAVSTRR